MVFQEKVLFLACCVLRVTFHILTVTAADLSPLPCPVSTRESRPWAWGPPDCHFLRLGSSMKGVA